MSPPNPARPSPASQRAKSLSVALACLLLAVAIGSFLPPKAKLILHSHGHFHYWGHLAIFGIVAFLAVQAATSPPRKVISVFACILFGLALEIGQRFVFHSPMEWKDVLVDVIGVTAGTLLAWMTTRFAPEVPAA